MGPCYSSSRLTLATHRTRSTSSGISPGICGLFALSTRAHAIFCSQSKHTRRLPMVRNSSDAWRSPLCSQTKSRTSSRAHWASQPFSRRSVKESAQSRAGHRGHSEPYWRISLIVAFSSVARESGDSGRPSSSAASLISVRPADGPSLGRISGRINKPCSPSSVNFPMVWRKSALRLFSQALACLPLYSPSAIRLKRTAPTILFFPCNATLRSAS